MWVLQTLSKLNQSEKVKFNSLIRKNSLSIHHDDKGNSPRQNGERQRTVLMTWRGYIFEIPLTAVPVGLRLRPWPPAAMNSESGLKLEYTRNH